MSLAALLAAFLLAVLLREPVPVLLALLAFLLAKRAERH